MSIEILKADITQLPVDAIVNAANHTLLGGGGVDGAIHRAAGPELLEFCKTLNGCETGQAKMTPGFNLRSKYVIHTVGPVWRDGQNQEPKLLQDCYENCLKLAIKHNIQSIAFPAISTGVYGYPKKEAAKIALKSMLDMESNFQKIIACVFSEQDKQIYDALHTSLKR